MTTCNSMRILVACEFSGRVRDAFIARGHDARSCDLDPTEQPGPHYVGNVETLLGNEWDMIIAFPPCRYLARSGAHLWKERRTEQEDAAEFFLRFIANRCQRVCVENPIGIMSTLYRKPDQIIQPWQFGHGETKATCLWLKGLPKLVPTNVVDGRVSATSKYRPSPTRPRDRSRTFTGIASAMADQWG